MLKTISAALLAVSVLVAPALAAGPAKTTGKTTQAPIVKTEKAKPSVLNAKAKMGRHHHRHFSHHRSHKKMGALKTHQSSKASVKHVAPTTRRG